MAKKGEDKFPSVGDNQNRSTCKTFQLLVMSCPFKPSLKFRQSFTGDANYEKEYRVLARGSCLDVPIFVDNEECLGLKLGRDQNNRVVSPLYWPHPPFSNLHLLTIAPPS